MFIHSAPANFPSARSSSNFQRVKNKRYSGSKCSSLFQIHRCCGSGGTKRHAFQMAKCCNPMPGDQIVGYITRGRGATIHRQDCPNILQTKDRERIAASGLGACRADLPVPVKIKAYDRQGLVSDISNLLQMKTSTSIM
jgi:(p)ppGpp synthase/HD superfamily hydrolase